jgi:hypothetical protein
MLWTLMWSREAHSNETTAQAVSAQLKMSNGGTGRRKAGGTEGGTVAGRRERGREEKKEEAVREFEAMPESGAPLYPCPFPLPFPLPRVCATTTGSAAGLRLCVFSRETWLSVDRQTDSVTLHILLSGPSNQPASQPASQPAVVRPRRLTRVCEGGGPAVEGRA